MVVVEFREALSDAVTIVDAGLPPSVRVDGARDRDAVTPGLSRGRKSIAAVSSSAMVRTSPFTSTPPGCSGLRAAPDRLMVLSGVSMESSLAVMVTVPALEVWLGGMIRVVLVDMRKSAAAAGLTGAAVTVMVVVAAAVKSWVAVMTA